MQAATLGARQGRANATVLSLATHFTGEGLSTLDIPYDTFIYRSMSKRESDLIDHAQAVVVSLGGIGTLWELMETWEKIYSSKKKPIPFIILTKQGSKEFQDLFHSLFVRTKLVHAKACQFLNLTTSADKAVELITMSYSERRRDVTNLCQIQHRKTLL
jgi:predicted Rossmann-fold nucleotide-binding protein